MPLIIRGAGQTKGVRSNALVESVDIYPTIAKLAGLPPPPDVDGYDLTPLWTNPDAPGAGTLMLHPFLHSHPWPPPASPPRRPAAPASSLRRLMPAPACHRQTQTQTVKDVAFSEYPRCAPLDAGWNDTTYDNPIGHERFF